MERKKLLIIICSILLVLAIALGGYTTWHVLHSTDDLSIRWTMMGAIGSWAGSIFGVIALVISLFALWLPQKVKIRVAVSSAMMANPIPGSENVEAYCITVKNIGMRAVTVNNVYLNFGGKKQNNIFVGMLNQGSVLDAFTPKFPKRLEAGESFDYYLLRDKLIAGLKHYEERTPRDRIFYVCVDEVTTGHQYHKTPWTLKTFIGENNEYNNHLPRK